MNVQEELVRMLQEKVGLDRPTAERAAEAVYEFLQANGPALLSQFGGSLGQSFGGLFGR